MGACSSCLGQSQDRDLSDDEENSRLLDDAHANQYGSFGDQNSGIAQVDPQERQREEEALQKVVAQTSNYLVDIFAMVPQNAPRVPSTVFPAQDARLLKYQHVLAKMSAKGLPNDTTRSPIDATQNVSDGWISDEDEVDEARALETIKSEEVGSLLGGFSDAQTAE